MNIELENLRLLPEILKELETIKKELANYQEKRWLSVKELSAYLSYSTDYIYKLKESLFIEGVHFFKKSGKILFDKVAIDDFVVGKENSDEINQQRRQIVDNVLSSVKEV